MGYEPHLITPFEDSGLSKYYKPFLIGEAAFEDSENVYPWRGRVKKREGTTLLSRLDKSVHPHAIPIPDSPVMSLATWINPLVTAGVVNYPEELIAFSCTNAYHYVGSDFDNITFDAAGTDLPWTGTDQNPFWTCNFAGSLWATNNIEADGIRFWIGIDGTLGVDGGWSVHNPLVNAAENLDTALMILPYKGRLVVLNTIENSVNYPQRARWCQLGTPYLTAGALYVPPTGWGGAADDDAWRSDIPGRGGYIDADTNERIVSAGIIKDTLIVAFQRSVWRLRYTGSELQPFIWERLNTQFGAESTFSVIAFDDVILFCSRFGWIGCDTNNVARIDMNIPDASFLVGGAGTTYSNNIKVQGIRDYYRQMALWTFPTSESNDWNLVFGYSYLDKTWSKFKFWEANTAPIPPPPAPPPPPSIPKYVTCFGNYRDRAGTTWEILITAADVWENFTKDTDTWEMLGGSIDFPYLVCGDSQGYVYKIFENLNAPNEDSVDKTGIGVKFDFDILTKRFNPYLKQGRKCKLAYVDIYCVNSNGVYITVEDLIEDNTVSGQIPALIKTVNIDTSRTIFPLSQNKYTRVYINSIAHMHQLHIYLDPTQIADAVSSVGSFELLGMVLWTKPEGRIRG